MTKEKLLRRYFQLENRISILERISQCIWVTDFQKRKRLNVLMHITRRKFRILDNHLTRNY